jgi:para-aminobenzoate synthetase/4-amino-4-deoxychorismate lyase
MPDPDPSLGVYETLLVRDRAVQALGAHVERMRGSATRLYGVAAPGDLADRIRATAGSLGAGEHRLRVDARPVDGSLSLAFQTGPLPPRRPLFRLAPLALAGGHSADKLADRGRLTNSGSAGPVPLLTDGDGPDAEVLEAAWANVWVVQAGRLLTPPVDGRILPGVTRARVIGRAQTLGLDVSVQPITVAGARAGELMLTSSLQLAAAAALEGSPEPSPESIATIDRIRAALLDSDWE